MSPGAAVGAGSVLGGSATHLAVPSPGGGVTGVRFMSMFERKAGKVDPLIAEAARAK